MNSSREEEEGGGGESMEEEEELGTRAIVSDKGIFEIEGVEKQEEGR